MADAQNHRSAEEAYGGCDQDSIAMSEGPREEPADYAANRRTDREPSEGTFQGDPLKQQPISKRDARCPDHRPQRGGHCEEQRLLEMLDILGKDQTGNEGKGSGDRADNSSRHREAKRYREDAPRTVSTDRQDAANDRVHPRDERPARGPSAGTRS